MALPKERQGYDADAGGTLPMVGSVTVHDSAPPTVSYTSRNTGAAAVGDSELLPSPTRITTRSATWNALGSTDGDAVGDGDGVGTSATALTGGMTTARNTRWLDAACAIIFHAPMEGCMRQREEGIVTSVLVAYSVYTPASQRSASDSSVLPSGAPHAPVSVHTDADWVYANSMRAGARPTR